MIGMNTPLISVAMATYNGEQYIRKQLDSIYTQTYSNIEVIVTDDCSSDATVNILKAYAKSHGLQYYVNKKKIGFKKNFEEAVSYCNGKYIAFADQDDIWLPQKLQVLVDNIGTNDLICSNATLIDEQDHIICQSWMEATKLFLCKKEDRFTCLVFRNFVTGCTVLIRKEFLDKYSPIPDTEKYHDYWFALCAAKNNGVEYLVEPLVLYRQHEEQDTGANELGARKILMLLSSFFSRLMGRETKRLQWAKVQEKRLNGLLALESDFFGEKDKEVIRDSYLYHKNYSDSFIHIKALLIGFKYSRVLYNRNYFYYKNFLRDLVG